MGVPGRPGRLVYRADPPSYLQLPAWIFSMIFVIIFWHRFRIPFGPILEPTWSQLGLQNRSKIDPRAIQNPLKNLSCFNYLFELIFDWFLAPTRLPNPPKTKPSWLPKAIQEAMTQNHKNIKNPYVFQWFWRLRGSQVEAKIDQNSIPKGIKSKMQLSIDFWWLLDRFFLDFGGQVGTKLAPKSIKNRSNNQSKK